MSHNLISVNSAYPDSTRDVAADKVNLTVLSEASPNSTVTSFNFADTGTTNRYYLFDGTISSIDSSVTDHGDGTYTLPAGHYLIQACLSFQTGYSTNSKGEFRLYDTLANESHGPFVAVQVNTRYCNDIGSNQLTSIFQFNQTVRIGIRCEDVATGVFTHSNQDTNSNQFLIITKIG